jgi:hypothetical protein
MNWLDLDGREKARYLTLARFAVGVACLVAPRRVARAWFGEGEPRITPIALRSIGGRDLAIAVGTMTALENGGDASAWLRAGATSDAADAAAFVLSLKHVQGLRRVLWPAVAGASAYVGLDLAEDLQD